MLNTTDSQQLELAAGDIVNIDVVSQSGSVDITLQKGREKPVYKDTNISTNSFQVEIAESGTYLVSVTGKNAKGSVNVIKEQSKGSHSEFNGTKIEMDLSENYSSSDPFVNARLFCVSDDIDVLGAEVSFQLDGESGILEIIDKDTDQVLWSNTWNESVDNDTIELSLEQIKKEKEYVIRFTGTKIKNAEIVVNFDTILVREQDRPLKSKS